MGQFSEHTLARLRAAVAQSSTRLPVSYMEERHSGDLLSVLNADLGKLKTLLANNLIDLPGQSIRALAAFIYILSVNWILALVSCIVTPLIFIVLSTLTQPVMKRSNEMQAEIGRVNSLAQDSLSGALVVKSFNLVGLLDERFRQANHQAVKKGLSIAWLRSIIDGASMGLSITPFIIAFGLGGYFILTGNITFGSLFAFINLLNPVVNALSNLPNIIGAMGEAAGAGQRVFEVIDQPAERSDGTVRSPQSASARQPTPAGQAAIQLNDISFAYSDGNPVLKNISLSVPQGQTVAIVGPSGGGKSTLLKLILGYYPLADGQLSLLGSDLTAWRLPSARAQMSLVSQDTYLFPVSIAENIRLGRPDATQKEVEHAAEQANIHAFISSLPDGYDTNAGEWGSRLSGGQRQRISLARAILKDSPILLLDEPTSALDSESEALVQEALERFTQGRTTVVIAHRLSTIQNADRVVVMDDGQVIEEGSHTELLAKGGLYTDLYQRQLSAQAAPPGSQSGSPEGGSSLEGGAL
jgi:ABC-type multidrug transport system fused ATPase/permease subunit